jgi:hypothetical protein
VSACRAAAPGIACCAAAAIWSWHCCWLCTHALAGRSLLCCSPHAFCILPATHSLGSATQPRWHSAHPLCSCSSNAAHAAPDTLPPPPAPSPLRPKAPAGKSVKFALSAEEVEAKTKAALDEYLMVADVAEAVRCFEEIAGPDSSKQITELVVDYLLNAIKEKQQEQLVELLAKAAKDGVLGKEQVEAALAGLTETLEDLRWGTGLCVAGGVGVTCAAYVAGWCMCSVGSWEGVCC